MAIDTSLKGAAEMLSKLYLLLGWELPQNAVLVPETFEGILMELKESLDASRKERVSAGRIAMLPSYPHFSEKPKIFISLENPEVSWLINIEKINRTGLLKGIGGMDKSSQAEFFQLSSKIIRLLEEHYEWEKKMPAKAAESLGVFCEVQRLFDELKKISKKLSPVYNLLNWGWTDKGVPSAERIEEALKKLAVGIMNGSEVSSSGGLTLRSHGDCLGVYFNFGMMFSLWVPRTEELQPVG